MRAAVASPIPPGSPDRRLRRLLVAGWIAALGLALAADAVDGRALSIVAGMLLLAVVLWMQYRRHTAASREPGGQPQVAAVAMTPCTAPVPPSPASPATPGPPTPPGAADEGAKSSEVSAAPVLLASLVGQMDHGLFRMGPDADLHYVSGAWERLTGLSAGESLGRTFTSFLHPHDRESARAAITQVVSGHRDHLASEMRMLSGGGGVRWIELRLSRDPGTRGAVGTATDITRRKQMEEGLRTSRRELGTLLANVPGMVYRGRYDRRWTMDFVSDGCVELTGYEPADIAENGRIAFGDLIHPDDREFVWALVETQLAQSKAFQLSYRIVDAAGQTKWVWEQGRGVFSSTGALLALEGCISDVSARRGAEEVARRKLWFDARTGLASRAIFDDRLAYVLDHARAVGYRCAVFWVDLDNFGEVNARFGRDFGDRVLVQFARRFKVIQGPGTIVARVGGDEFAVLVTELRLGGGAREGVPGGRDFPATAERIAESLAATLARPLRLDGRELTVTASVGLAVSRENHVSAEAILQDARRAAGGARTDGHRHWRTADA